MRYKTAGLEVESADAEGSFRALVSAFGVKDAQGDRVVKGAFARTLREWQSSGDPIPLLTSHQAHDVMSHVGVVDPANVEETEKGLVIVGQLDVDDNPAARQTHKLMKRRSLKEFSIGYTVAPGGQRKTKDATELTDIDLVELSVCLRGSNPATELLSIKGESELRADTRRRTLALLEGVDAEVAHEARAKALRMRSLAVAEHEERLSRLRERSARLRSAA